jgi:ribosomal small subunit protein bTHX
MLTLPKINIQHNSDTMGKGDKKTKRGKIIMGSYGVRRPKNAKKQFAPGATSNEAVTKVAKPVKEDVPKEKKKPAAVKKAVAEKSEQAPKDAPKKKTTRKTTAKDTENKKEAKKAEE